MRCGKQGCALVSEAATKACPFCAETIKAAALLVANG
jgi:hypothetical protein